VIRCSSEDCERPATEVLWLRDQPGHVHDCAEHAHDVREWCDVVKSTPLEGDECPTGLGCDGATFIHFSPPTPL